MTLSLSGCFPSTHWVKPGASVSEWEQTKAACMMEGAERVPVVMVYTLRPGSSRSARHCDKNGQNCTVDETVTPPSYSQSDSNAGLRNQVVRGCYARHGWFEVEDK